jgi:hypothetical protein
MEILNKIKEIDYNVLNKRPKIKFIDKLSLFLKSRRKKII